MPTGHERRLGERSRAGCARVPAALSGYTESLRLAASRGDVRAPAPGAGGGGTQCAENTGPDGFFATLARDAKASAGVGPAGQPARGSGLGRAGRRRRLRGARRVPARGAAPPGARARCGRPGRLCAVLPLVPRGARRPRGDLRLGSGRAGPHHRGHAGHRRADQVRGCPCARRWRTSTPIPARKLDGTDALQAWMQDKSDAAVDALAGTHFDIPDRDPSPGLPDRADPDRRHLLHPARARTSSPGRARCGGRCPRASPSSRRGASSRPSTTRACRAITCRSPRPSTAARS